MEGINLTLQECEDLITPILIKIGIPPRLKGYRYARTAVALILRSPDLINGWVTKELYPQVGKHHGCKTSSVERAIRHAISVGFDRGDKETLQNIFGHTISSRKFTPTNSEFMAMIAEVVREQVR